MAALDNTAYQAAIEQDFSASTLRCGGERAVFSGTVSMYDPTGPNPPPPEGALAVIVDWRFGMWDGDDDDEDEIDHQSGQMIVPAGETRVINPSLRDSDIPPDRAHAEITVDNFVEPFVTGPGPVAIQTRRPQVGLGCDVVVVMEDVGSGVVSAV